MQKQIVISEILAHIRLCGGGYPDWYVGIAAEPKDRLFNSHGVRQGDAWIHRECDSSAAAREVEAYFVKTLGAAGGPGGGDYSTTHVYAYKIAPHTVESA